MVINVMLFNWTFDNLETSDDDFHETTREERYPRSQSQALLVIAMSEIMVTSKIKLPGNVRCLNDYGMPHPIRRIRT